MYRIYQNNVKGNDCMYYNNSKYVRLLGKNTLEQGDKRERACFHFLKYRLYIYICM